MSLKKGKAKGEGKDWATGAEAGADRSASRCQSNLDFVAWHASGDDEEVGYETTEDEEDGEKGGAERGG